MKANLDLQKQSVGRFRVRGENEARGGEKFPKYLPFGEQALHLANSRSARNRDYDGCDDSKDLSPPFN
jgi:hypothetical protein